MDSIFQFRYMKPWTFHLKLVNAWLPTGCRPIGECGEDTRKWLTHVMLETMQTTRYGTVKQLGRFAGTKAPLNQPTNTWHAAVSEKYTPKSSKANSASAQERLLDHPVMPLCC